jgi:AraC-like DNA-binding protein
MLKDLIIYSPVFIAFFWSVVFLASPARFSKSKRTLGFFMLAAFGIYFSHASYFKIIDRSFWYFDAVYTLCSLSVYPLYYFYLWELTTNAGFKKSDFKNFLPAIILSISVFLAYLFMTGEEQAAYVNGFLYKTIPLDRSKMVNLQIALFYVGRTVYALQIIFYLLKGIALLKIYEIKILNFYSYLEDKSLKWATLLTYTFFLAAITSIIANFIGRSVFFNNSDSLFIPSLLFSSILFLIGLEANIQKEFDSKDLMLAEEENDIEFSIKEDHQQFAFSEKLEELFRDKKLYLNPDLKITDLSKLLATNRTYISNYINHIEGKSFSAYINSYRIKEAKEILQNKGNGDLKLDEVAEQCGFGSFRTFSRAFHNEVGFGPKEYKKKYNSNSHTLD